MLESRFATSLPPHSTSRATSLQSGVATKNAKKPQNRHSISYASTGARSTHGYLRLMTARIFGERFDAFVEANPGPKESTSICRKSSFHTKQALSRILYSKMLWIICLTNDAISRRLVSPEILAPALDHQRQPSLPPEPRRAPDRFPSTTIREPSSPSPTIIRLTPHPASSCNGNCW